MVGAQVRVPLDHRLGLPAPRPLDGVEINSISWDEGRGMQERAAVKRGLRPRRGRPARVNEKAIAKRHRYLTIVG